MAAAKQVKLYYFPGSYYSLKTLTALYELDVAFEEHIVNILAEEQNQEWYLTINKNGEVPVLEIDGNFISESEKIIDVIDQTFSSDSRLVPDVETRYGSDVRDFRRILHDVPIAVITYGVVCNPQVIDRSATSDSVFSRQFNRESTNKRFSRTLDKLKKERASCPPELREAFDLKINKITRRLENVMNPELVSVCLDDLEKVLDKIEERLIKSEREATCTDHAWLFGPSFTAADITAATLMYRLYFIGIDTRYFSSTKRPMVHEYYTRLLNRPAIAKMVAKFATTKA